jgi:hypothetical protein
MNKFVKVIAFTYPHEAHLAKCLLESFGINVIIEDEYTVQVNNFYSNAVGGVKLLVEETQVENALSILKEGEYIKPQYQKPKIKFEKFSSEYKEKCPYCESTNIIKKKNWNYAKFIVMLFGLPTPFCKKKYFCFDCDNDWIIKK